ncbi:MAG: acyltransferase [Deltaproteobacteria bacterium]|nr:acyltransferase [Deltaproteobacteria bacterium]MBI3390794.1 acyltransferase [Deltaproteobacteria bacterium]
MGDGIIEIGREVEIAPDLSLLVGLGTPEPPLLRIGDYAHVGPQNIFCVARGLTIGTHVRTGPGVCIYDNDMHPMDPVRRREQNDTMPFIKSAPVVIEDDAWIGLHALVLKGVTIGRGAVVAAGAVVTASVPAGCVVAGNPARVVTRLDGSSVEAQSG